MAKNKSVKIAIVIPAYNESKTIASVISDIKQTIGENYIYEIIVVDDGSKDATASIAEEHGAIVIRHILNSGSGGATATGLSYAQQKGFSLAVTMDGDGQHSAQDVLNGINYMYVKSPDLLIGSRLIDSKGMSKVKVLGNRGLSFITFITFGIRVTDSQSGLRVFSQKALNNLKWKTAGYEFCSEMLWRARQQGLVIKEYPIEAIYTEYSVSKGQNNWNAVNIVRSLVQRRLMEIFGE